LTFTFADTFANTFAKTFAKSFTLKVAGPWPMGCAEK